jgi:hypothetical protein
MTPNDPSFTIVERVDHDSASCPTPSTFFGVGKFRRDEHSLPSNDAAPGTIDFYTAPSGLELEPPEDEDEGENNDDKRDDSPHLMRRPGGGQKSYYYRHYKVKRPCVECAATSFPGESTRRRSSGVLLFDGGAAAASPPPSSSSRRAPTPSRSFRHSR